MLKEEKEYFLYRICFLLQKKYIIEKYIKNKRDVTVNKRLNKELENKAAEKIGSWQNNIALFAVSIQVNELKEILKKARR